MSECHCRNLDVVMPKKSVKPWGKTWCNLVVDEIGK